MAKIEGLTPRLEELFIFATKSFPAATIGYFHTAAGPNLLSSSPPDGPTTQKLLTRLADQHKPLLLAARAKPSQVKLVLSTQTQTQNSPPLSASKANGLLLVLVLNFLIPSEKEKPPTTTTQKAT